MFRKSFVSLYFLPGELQLVQLNSGRKKVKKYATISLPQGLIASYKVTDKKALAQILRSAWKKLQLKEKSVFIVIPEFSTFVKLFEVSDVNISELNEAVGWHVHEFLPSNLKEMILDWKIVKKENNIYQILAVAVNKDILGGYVQAVENANLFPLVVEIPSLSLTRIIGGERGASLLIYQSSKDTILAVLDKDKVLGSSVVQDREVKDIEATAKRMTSHFKNMNISRLVVGGVDFDKSLMDKLSKSFGIKVEFLKKEVKNLNDEEIQNYLIPISSQLQEPVEPSDPFSLNLLPAKLVEKYKGAKLRLQIWSLTLTITLFVSVSFLLTLGVYLFITQQVTDFRNKNTFAFQLAKKKEEAAVQIKKINSVVDKVGKIQKAAILPQDVLNDIAKAMVGGISIDKYNLEFDKGLAFITGSASNRQSLLAFKQNLELDPNISQLKVPISSFEKGANLEFEISFTYLKDKSELMDESVN